MKKKRVYTYRPELGKLKIRMTKLQQAATSLSWAGSTKDPVEEQEFWMREIKRRRQSILDLFTYGV